MPEINSIKDLALVAGNGKFPLFVCRAAKNQGIRVVAIAIKGEISMDLSKYADKIYNIDLGQGGKFLEILKKENIKHVAMAGKIKKINILKQAFKIDDVAKSVLKAVINKGDNTILTAIAGRLKKENIYLLDSTKFLKELLVKKGVCTKRNPTRMEKEDMGFGFKIAKQIANLDIGQTVVVKEKAVIAIEAIEGTDQAIIRSGNFSQDCIVVKVSRSDHDMRFDVPTVGLSTIEAMIKARASVLAVEAHKTLILEKEAVIEKADKAGICIIAI